jgi:cytochrome c553
MKRSPLKRSGRLKPRSKKRQQLYARKGGRRDFVASMLRRYPKCQASISARCEGRSVDVHELLARSQGGSILDEENCIAVCRHCHDWIGNNPKKATIAGLRISRFNKYTEAELENEAV